MIGLDPISSRFTGGGFALSYKHHMWRLEFPDGLWGRRDLNPHVHNVQYNVHYTPLLYIISNMMLVVGPEGNDPPIFRL